ncbi:MAG: UDP-glucose 4-epimerase GalE [Syntrophomonadaceae bacterium]|nr:UDP-glucose 4-epimerase GalE [Syntrophomonadaceae bacterium]
MQTILITGGAGYIGSHIVKLLGERGYNILVYDNLSSGHEWAVLFGRLIRGDILDFAGLSRVFNENDIAAVIQLAAYISVPESIQQPLEYYLNNVSGTINLLKVMGEYGVSKMIFSSSAAVYGIPPHTPVNETSELRPINPYGRSKAMVEQVLQDLSNARDFKYVALRYFNVAGADPGGSIGEGKEDAAHLITASVRTAVGKKAFLNIYGNDYPTRDGSCVRDYIHVEDLAYAHLLSLEHLLEGGDSRIYNCGYGHGYSVLEVMETVRRVTGAPIPVRQLERRKGDPPELVADTKRIKAELHWRPLHDDLEDIVETAWRWELKYQSKTLK